MAASSTSRDQPVDTWGTVAHRYRERTCLSDIRTTDGDKDPSHGALPARRRRSTEAAHPVS
jgi:hypothetical protein